MPPAIPASVPVQGTDLQYYLLSYDETPAERAHPAGKISDHILAAVKSQPITDVFLFSHGWLGDVGAANEQYQGWLKTMWNLSAGREAMRKRNPNFQPLLIGLHWPSLPWGNESLDAPLSFGDDPAETIVSAYAKRLGDSANVRAALQKVVAISQSEDPQDALTAELRGAYADLAKAVDLPESGPQAAPGADWDGFDPEAIYEAFRKDDAESGVVSFGTTWRDSLLAPLRALSFWKMKDRARIFGEQAIHPFLRKIQEAAPQARTHLAGHSFGCIVATAAVAGPPGSSALARPIDSLILLQGALSLWSFSKKIPFAGQGAGYFQRVLENKLVSGPIVTTQSEHDTAVGTWYPRAARVAGQVAFAQDFPKYGAVGTFGAQGDNVAPQKLMMLDVTKPYTLKAGQIYNVESSDVIDIGGGFSGAHSDIRKPAVAHLVWSAIIGQEVPEPFALNAAAMSDDSDDAELEQFEVSDDLKQQFTPILEAIRLHSRRLQAFPEAVYVRPGFKTTAGAATPVVIIGVLPALTRAAEKQASDLSRELNIPIELEEASPQSQVSFFATGLPTLQSELSQLLEPGLLAFGPPRMGNYEPPESPKLQPVEAKMKLTIATSPDAGWPTLSEFLSKPVDKIMNIGIYQFTAEHVYKVLRRTMLADDDAVLRITTHPSPEAIPENGTKSDDVFGPTLLDRLGRALGGRFQHAPTTVGKGGEFASAYHIKVIVADKKRFWLSSGNLQSSNQPPFDPLNGDELPANFQRSYNREHHVVIENAALAKIFAGFLEYDFKRASEALVDFGPQPALPDLIMPPEAELVDFAPPKFFPPLKLNENVRVQPILTPDNYAPLVADLIKGAKSRLWIQNQYINLNPTEDFPEFKKIINLIKKKIKDGLDVRIICRDMMGQDKLDMLLALGFPREVFRFMTATHTKIIIVDDKRVLVGSHNFSNEGVVSNRDASLIIDHPKVVEFCAEVFDYDWNRRATAKPMKSRPRVARPGEQPAMGATRVSWSSVFDEAPRPAQAQPRRAPDPLMAFSESGKAATDSEVLVNGIDAKTGKLLVPPVSIAALAETLRGKPEPIAPELMASININKFRAFGLADSIDPDDVRKAGWGVVIPEGRDDLFELVKPLWDHRAKSVPADRLKKLTYKPNETCRNWLKRHGMAFGSQLPTVVPYHLLLVAPPTDISFDFQYLLDLEYSVGRLWFDKPENWKSYCEAVIAAETKGSDRTRQIAWLAPRHDPATTLSHDDLVTPLIKPDPSGFTTLSDFESIRLLGKDATRDNLLKALREQKPAFLFTASHGLGYDMGDADQKDKQGALLTADWQGGAVDGKCFAAEHVDCDVRGMIAFLFACFGVGTPVRDNYPMDLKEVPKQLTDVPFVAALPQKLLAQGALAVVGHVDRAWGCSIRPAGVRDRVGPFRNFVDRILRGRCVGNSTRDFSERSGTLSDELLSIVAPGGTPVDDDTLVASWIERNDAHSYVLLGDPTVRIKLAGS